MEATGGYFDNDGNTVNYINIKDVVKNIDPSVTKYLNTYDIAAFAFGISGNYPWDETLEQIAKNITPENQMAMALYRLCIRILQRPRRNYHHCPAGPKQV